jgi:E3 SUMO-protein ligase PIAS1
VRSSIDEDGLEEVVSSASLRCVLTLARMKTPVKGEKCRHEECYDLESYLRHCRDTGVYECPSCRMSCFVHDLVVDKYIDKILKSVPEDVLNVHIKPDGTWEHVPSGSGLSIGSSTQAVESKSGFGGGVVDEIVESQESGVDMRQGQAKLGGRKGSRSTLESEIIDIDDDDDDDAVIYRTGRPSVVPLLGEKRPREIPRPLTQSFSPRQPHHFSFKAPLFGPDSIPSGRVQPAEDRASFLSRLQDTSGEGQDRWSGFFRTDQFGDDRLNGGNGM